MRAGRQSGAGAHRCRERRVTAARNRRHLFVWLCFLPWSASAAAPMLAAGTGYAYAIKADGTAAAWGRNEIGQLGNGQAAMRASPGKVAGIDQVSAVAAGFGYTLALRSDGLLWSWGFNADGELGDGTTQSRSYPVPVSGISGSVASIAAGSDHAFAVTTDGDVWAWGYGGSGALGTGDRGNQTTPVRVAGLSGVYVVASGSFHTLALADHRRVWGWGGKAARPPRNG